MRLATRFSCKRAGFDTLSQRPLAERVEANGREATGSRSSYSSAPRRMIPWPVAAKLESEPFVSLHNQREIRSWHDIVGRGQQTPQPHALRPVSRHEVKRSLHVGEQGEVGTINPWIEVFNQHSACLSAIAAPQLSAMRPVISDKVEHAIHIGEQCREVAIVRGEGTIGPWIDLFDEGGAARRTVAAPQLIASTPTGGRKVEDALANGNPRGRGECTEVHHQGRLVGGNRTRRASKP